MFPNGNQMAKLDGGAVAASSQFASRQTSSRFGISGSFHTSECRGGVERRQSELKGVEGGDWTHWMGGETRPQKSLRIGVHHADAVVWEPV
jgi:hypothetical protein